ncbi:MAG TPA: universal stress protein [Solirubrobacteraceae bacterium]
MTTFRHVLVACDDSDGARQALARAADLTGPGDVVSVVNVMPEPGVSARLEPPEGLARQALVLDEAQQFLAARGIEARAIAPVGNPASEILTEREHADLIVIARHSGHVAHLLGSVSGRVVRSAHCDVLVVHGTDSGARR